MDRYLKRGRRFTLGARRSTPVIKIAKMQGNLMELVGNNPESRNWKGMLISLFVILLVCGLVVLSVILLTPDSTLPDVPNVNLSDIMEERWKLPDDVWIGENLIFKDVIGNVVKISSSDSEPEILISKQTMKDNGIVDYKISEDGKYALFVYKKASIYTYSYNASYYVYNIKSRTKEPLIHAESQNTFQFAGFGKNGSSIIYSLNGDLYYKPNVYAESERLTTGGIFGVYQNGMADWLYEEKILKSSIAHWWSPSGQYLAYASFDDTDVEDSYVTIYTDASDVITYTKESKYKYPKAGYPNPIVKIHALNLETKDQVTFVRSSWEGYRLDTFQSLTWLSDDEILITWSNRTMTASVMQQCYPTIATCVDGIIRQSVNKKKVGITNEESGWLTNLDQQALPSDDESVFFYILPSDHGGMGGFNHLAVVNKTQKPSSIRFLTEGNWEVTKLFHYDENTGEVYYVSNEKHHGSRHIYRVDMNGAKQCVTCRILPTGNTATANETDGGSTYEVTRCQHYEASFGKSSDWFRVKCLGPGVPYSGIVSSDKTATPYSSTLKILTPPDRTLSGMVLPTTTYYVIPGKDGADIRIKMLVPANIHVGKRPVVFFKREVGSQTVDFKFYADLAAYIVKSVGAVAMFVDGKGSGGRGKQILHHAARNPGIFEIEDMKFVLKYFKEEENIDVASVAVVGSSGYGGYVAALSLTHSEFKCGVATSPVTDWSLYDAFGSERLLGSPLDNPLVYQKTNLLNLIEGIKNSKLKIFHGMQNRKVNIQHSVLLKQAAMLTDLPLESVDITYYPSTGSISRHEANQIESNIYESIRFFLRNCLFGDSEVGRKKLELLETNYGISR